MFLGGVVRVQGNTREKQVGGPWHTVSTMVAATSSVCPSVHPPSPKGAFESSTVQKKFLSDPRSVSALSICLTSHMWLQRFAKVTSVTEQLRFESNFFLKYSHGFLKTLFNFN